MPRRGESLSVGKRERFSEEVKASDARRRINGAFGRAALGQPGCLGRGGEGRRRRGGRPRADLAMPHSRGAIAPPPHSRLPPAQLVRCCRAAPSVSSPVSRPAAIRVRDSERGARVRRAAPGSAYSVTTPVREMRRTRIATN